MSVSPLILPPEQKSDSRDGLRKRYAMVGMGSRSKMFSDAILGTYASRAALVGLCDVNQTRMDFYNASFGERFGVPAVPTYPAADFARLLAEQRPDVVIVTSVDRTHDRYIVAAMEAGCDVITEKPMTTDPHKCRAILEAVERTGRSLRVTFNYRYSPARTRIKELLAAGVIGEVKSVHFEWLLDTRHGADYFRRWHREKANSGGLMVHKSTHHFDLVNWWLDRAPQTVFGFGRLAFYGRENARGAAWRAATRGAAPPRRRATRSPWTCAGTRPWRTCT